MRLVVFGLSVSSAWGNGHATLWRGLAAALGARGHQVVFFERDVPYYAQHRDLPEIAGLELILYEDWGAVRPAARRELAACDAALVTSYCPDGVAASREVLERARGTRGFYDLDAPVTLAGLERGERPPYLLPEGLGGFDLVLSFTGGRALELLCSQLGARRAAPLYGCVDPALHRAAPPEARYASELSYLGTWAADRQPAVERLFLEPARRRAHRRFLLGGAQYPPGTAWPDNVRHLEHVPPREHGAFFCSSRLTLNLTRRDMARLGHCPSGRLFEAAACGAPIVTDDWPGLAELFVPGEEILLARDTGDVLGALERSDVELRRIGAAARERVLAEHTAGQRAEQLLAFLSHPHEVDHAGHHPRRWAR